MPRTSGTLLRMTVRWDLHIQDWQLSNVPENITQFQLTFAYLLTVIIIDGVSAAISVASAGKSRLGDAAKNGHATALII